MKRLLFIVGILSITLNVKAQQQLSVQQCVDEAIKNNLSVKDKELSQAITDADIEQAKSGLFPQVNFQGQYTYYTQEPKQWMPGSLFGSSEQYVEGGFTMAQQLQASVQLVQPLYNGIVWQGVKAAKASKGLNVIQVKQTQETLAFNVENTYYNIQSLDERIKLVQYNLGSIEKILAATNSLVKNQLTPKVDANRVEVSKKSLETQLKTIELNRDKLYNYLKYLMGRSVNDNIQVEPFKGGSTLPSTLEESLESNQNTQIALLEKTIELKELQKQSVKSSYWPIVNLVGAYALTGYNNEFNPFDYIKGRFFPTSYVGMQLQVPVFDGFNRRAQIRKIEAENERSRNQIAMVKNQTELDIANAVNDYKSNVITLKLQEENIKLAQEVYEDRQVQFKNGLAKINDVVLAENDLRLAQTDYINALINIRTSELNYRKAKSELLKN